MQKPIEKPIKFVKNLSTKGKSYPITHVSAVIDDNGESVKSTIDSLKNKSSVTKVTWQELKDKRDAGKLIPGSLYRITDYQCTTTQKNTQSAGHQFDIVLLALSENKLAEEGWAMMHDNVYDVTFVDGVTRKCYLYNTDNDEWNIVDVQTLLGIEAAINGYEIIINEESKTVTMTNRGYNSDYLETENLTYNYFQNSNLSAWKVWYCLDNDKSRFAWADDSMDEDVSTSFITISNDSSIIYYYKNPVGGKYLWESSDDADVYTDSETPGNGDTVYEYQKRTGYKTIGTVTSYIAAHEGTNLPNGRGVIYRLIDEWGNDVAYDFKNILYLRKLHRGSIDANGTDTYIPTFCLYDNGNDEYKDASIFAIYYPSDENIIGACYDNVIKMVNTSDIEECYAFKLPNNIILELVETGDTSWQTHSNIIFAKSCSFGAIVNCNVIHANERTYTYIPSGIIFENKQVVWEDIS